MYRFLSELWEGENAGVKLYSVLRKRLETTVCTENEIFSFEIIFFSYIAIILKKHQITIQNTLRSLIR